MEKKIGLALSGGGARGFAHVGVLRALVENDIPIDMIAGTSAGSFVGGAFAAGLSVDEIIEIGKKISWFGVAGFSYSPKGFLSNAAMGGFIDKNFPVVPNQGFMPDAFTSEDYLERSKAVDLCGGAIVSGSFQAFDQSYLFHALKVLGPSFVGVTQVPQTVSDQELRELDGAGVRAVLARQQARRHRNGCEEPSGCSLSRGWSASLEHPPGPKTRDRDHRRQLVPRRRCDRRRLPPSRLSLGRGLRRGLVATEHAANGATAAEQQDEAAPEKPQRKRRTISKE